jgi:hypothetical protein
MREGEQRSRRRNLPQHDHYAERSPSKFWTLLARRIFRARGEQRWKARLPSITGGAFQYSATRAPKLHRAPCLQWSDPMKMSRSIRLTQSGTVAASPIQRLGQVSRARQIS